MTNSSQKDGSSEGSSNNHRAVSAPMIIFMTALDTTWRLFVPTLGGVFAGIGLDYILRSAPWATIVCLLLGVVLSFVLIVKQLRDVRKPLKK